MLQTMENDEDAALLAGVRQRQGPAFERLMRRYNRLLFRTVRGIVDADAEAEDVVQDAWLRAFTGIDGFRGDSSLSTWLVRIAMNRAFESLRERRRFVSWEETSAEQEGRMHERLDTPSPFALAEPTPEEHAERAQLRRRMEAAIDLLPPIYRIVFILRAVEGLGVEETAAALQVSPDVVKTRLLRARAMLRGHLQEPDGGGLQELHAFDGRRCDAMVSGVLARLRSQGVIRDH